MRNVAVDFAPSMMGSLTRSGVPGLKNYANNPIGTWPSDLPRSRNAFARPEATASPCSRGGESFGGCL